MANFLEEWSNHGFVILPVVDGDTPNAKQALVGHIEKREKNRAKAVERRRELRRAMASQSEESLTIEEQEELSDSCKKMGRAIRTAETQAVNVVPTDYANLLEEVLQKSQPIASTLPGARY